MTERTHDQKTDKNKPRAKERGRTNEEERENRELKAITQDSERNENENKKELLIVVFSVETKKPIAKIHDMMRK